MVRAYKFYRDYSPHPPLYVPQWSPSKSCSPEERRRRKTMVKLKFELSWTLRNSLLKILTLDNIHECMRELRQLSPWHVSLTTIVLSILLTKWCHFNKNKNLKLPPPPPPPSLSHAPIRHSQTDRNWDKRTHTHKSCAHTHTHTHVYGGVQVLLCYIINNDCLYKNTFVNDILKYWAWTGNVAFMWIMSH